MGIAPAKVDAARAGGFLRRMGLFCMRMSAVVGVLCVLMFGAAQAQPASAPTPVSTTPATCSIGAFVTGLHDIDSAAGTFKADLWLWSVCPTKDLEPLKTLDFLNGVDVRTSLDNSLPRGASWWSTRKVSGTFREGFELDSFPFDRHPLTIRLEAEQGDSGPRLVADSAHSGLDPGIGLPGWRLKGFSVGTAGAVYPTSFGDPAAPQGVTRRPHVDIVIRAERAHLAIFAKLSIALYISAFLVLISLMLDVGNTDLFIGRIGLHASALFAVVLNWVSAGATVGHHESLTLLDQIHVATLILVLGTGLWSVFAYRAVVGGVRAARVQRWDGRSALLFLAAFLLVNAAIFANAIHRGSYNPPAYAEGR